MIDGYHAAEQQLDSIKVIDYLLNEIILTLNLEAAMPPFLLPYYYAQDCEDDGISAFVTLHGGHITVHTFPHRGCFFLDLLYDGYFDERKLRAILTRTFNYNASNEKCVRTERRYLDTTIESDKIWHGGDSVADFGPHTIARAENVNISFEEIYDLLDKMPQIIGMTPISRPYVLKTKDYISGIILIAQSHIAFHYCVSEKKLFCDLFSCSFYRAEKFVECIASEYKNVEQMTLIRGSKHDLNVDSREYKAKTLGKWSAK